MRNYSPSMTVTVLVILLVAKTAFAVPLFATPGQLVKRSQISDLINGIASAGNAISNCTSTCSILTGDINKCGGGSDSCLCEDVTTADAQSCSSCADSYGASTGQMYGDYIRACDDLGSSSSSTSTTSTSTTSTTSTSTTSTLTSSSTTQLTSSTSTLQTTQPTTQTSSPLPTTKPSPGTTAVPITATTQTQRTSDLTNLPTSSNIFPAVTAWIPQNLSIPGQDFGVIGTTGGQNTTLFANVVITETDNSGNLQTVTATDVLILGPSAFAEVVAEGAKAVEIYCTPGGGLGAGACDYRQLDGTSVVEETIVTLTGAPTTIPFQLPSEPISLGFTINLPSPSPSTINAGQLF